MSEDNLHQNNHDSKIIADIIFVYLISISVYTLYELIICTKIINEMTVVYLFRVKCTNKQFKMTLLQKPVDRTDMIWFSDTCNIAFFLIFIFQDLILINKGIYNSQTLSKRMSILSTTKSTK